MTAVKARFTKNEQKHDFLLRAFDKIMLAIEFLAHGDTLSELVEPVEQFENFVRSTKQRPLEELSVAVRQLGLQKAQLTKFLTEIMANLNAVGNKLATQFGKPEGKKAEAVRLSYDFENQRTETGYSVGTTRSKEF